jgi:hypothetical protein
MAIFFIQLRILPTPYIHTLPKPNIGLVVEYWWQKDMSITTPFQGFIFQFSHIMFWGFFPKIYKKIVEFTVEKYSPNKSFFLLDFFCQNKIHCSFYIWNIWIVHVFMTTSSQGETSPMMLKDFNLTKHPLSFIFYRFNYFAYLS